MAALFSLAPAVQAAIIVSAVTFLTAVVNVTSAHFIRRQERASKHEDWFVEKQVRDVEEIVTTLSSFLKNLSESLQSLNAIQSIENWSIERDFAVRKEHISGSDYDVSYVQTSKSSVTDSLERAGRDLNKALETFWNQEAERVPWFDFDAKRLSVWFDGSEGIDELLSRLGEQFHEFHLSVNLAASNLQFFYGQLAKQKGELTEEDVEMSQRLSREFETAVEKQHDVSALAIGLQKTLINRFRSRKLTLWGRLKKLGSSIF